MTNNTITIACRTLGNDFRNLSLTKLLDANNVTLNDISYEILSIVTSKYDSHIYYHSLMIDIEGICQSMNIDCELEVYISDLTLIIMDVRARLKQFHIENCNLIAINFNLPDNIFFTYS